jgi:hypothetical protein
MTPTTQGYIVDLVCTGQIQTRRELLAGGQWAIHHHSLIMVGQTLHHRVICSTDQLGLGSRELVSRI